MKIKNKLLLLSLMSMLGTNLVGCSNNNQDEQEEVNIEINEEEQIGSTESIKEKEEISESTEPVIEEIQIPEETVEEVIIDPKEEALGLIESGNIQNVYYATDEVNINVPSYLASDGIEYDVTIPKLECLEVYGKKDDMLLVKVDDCIGYVSINNLEELYGTFVVVDISSQELKLYSDNEVILTSPVVTGKPSTPSDKGLFEIYNISGPRYLIGPNYKSYVDIMMKYNGGEGLHDAQYHTHEDGFKHGWRNLEEFGGDTYLKDGSHGCINMIRDDVMTVREHVDIGTKVLVKE